MQTILRHSIYFAVVTSCLTSACVKDKPTREAVSAARHSKKSSPESHKTQPHQATSAPATSEIPQGDTKESVPAVANKSATDSVKTPSFAADCDTSVKFKDEEPVFLPQSKVMVTRIISACVDKNGNPGHRKNAGWMAMGFPCTGGEGRIDWKGTNYQRPKMVTFLLETSCAMGPTDKSKIQAEAMDVLGISKEANFIAFNPFVIQYWEVPGYGDADTSYTVELRSGKGLDQGWTSFIKPKPMRIFLVGRENAWVPGNFMYAVEGDLHWINKNRFTFKVDTSRVLHSEELAEIKTRCESLKPPRDCGRVF